VDGDPGKDRINQFPSQAAESTVYMPIMLNTAQEDISPQSSLPGMPSGVSA
jgi:hypothetical protein